MKLRPLLRLILLITALVASGAVTGIAHAVPSGECAAWDKECTEDCWYQYSVVCPYYGHSSGFCQQSYDECMYYCCISYY